MGKPALVTVDGSVPAQDQELDELRANLQQFNKEISHSYFRMAACLKRAFEIRAHASWGYHFWKDYVESELDMSERKAQYLMRVHHWFVIVLNDDTVRDRVEHLGWTKVKMLVGVVDEKNVDEWVYRAESMTSVQLEEYIKALRVGEDPTEKGADNASTISFKLFPGQAENIEDALELAAKIAESDKRGHALDLICTTFKQDHIFQTRPGDKLMKHWLNKTAAIADLNLIAISRGTGEIITGEDYLEKAILATPRRVQQALLGVLTEALK